MFPSDPRNFPSSASSAFHTDTPTPQGLEAPPPETKLALQWGSGGECRVHEDDCQAVCDAVDRCAPGNYRSVFPVHGSWGALSLGVDGRTVWLYTSAGAFIAGELVDPNFMRPRGLPANGQVDISKLTPDVQAAIAMLMKQAAAGRR